MQPTFIKWTVLSGLIFFIILSRSNSLKQSTKINSLFIDWIQENQQVSDQQSMVSDVDCQSINNVRQRGLCFMLQNDLPALEEITLFLLKTNSHQQMLAIHLGYAYRDANLADKAVAIWDRAGAWIHLAFWGIEIDASGNPEKAADLIELAVDDILLKPFISDTEARYLKNALSILTRVRMEQENYAAAIDAYQARLILQPTSAFNHQQIGVAYRQLGNYPDARAWLKKAEILAPDDVEIAQELGRVAAAEGQWGDAIAYFEKVAERKSDPQLQYELGIAYENGLDYAAAREAFAEAVELSGGNRIRYRLALAEVCEQIGCTDISVEQYCLILKQDPDHKKARDQLLLLLDQPSTQIGQDILTSCP